MLVLVHSGQTGVERGAHRAALAAGVTIAGFMPVDQRDEMGPIPSDVASRLTTCFERGPRPATRANIAIASGLLLVVPDASEASTYTAMSAVLSAARVAKIPVQVVDPASNLDEVATWVRQLPKSSGSVRLLVTGPRSTRWHTGEATARRLVSAITIAT